MLRQSGQNSAGQNIAAAHALIAQDAVIEQVIANTFMRAQERRIGSAFVGDAGLRKPQVRGEWNKANMASEVQWNGKPG